MAASIELAEGNRLRAHGKACSLLAILFLCQMTPAPADEVSVAKVDVDGDGVFEFVLENEYIRLVLDRGVSPAEPGHDRYGPRFVWGGWIRELSWRPTKREYFLIPRLHEGLDTIFTGMPEEFEQIIPTEPPEAEKQGAGSTPKDLLLKIGVGICRGIRTGPASWKEIDLESAAPWSVETSGLPDGGKAVTFKQVLAPVDGYSYQYMKRFRLHPGRSSVLVRRTLQNIGAKRIETTWYLHPCFAQGDGNQYDRHCWSAAPVSSGAQPSDIDTSNCIPPRPNPLGIWGALSGRSIPEPWIAAGHDRKMEIMATILDKPIEWLRVWTWTHCYALEPFELIDLEPGETWESAAQHMLGSGLRGVTGVGKGGFLELIRQRQKLVVRFLPDKSSDALTLKLSAKEGASDRIILSDVYKLGSAHPDTPATRAFALEHGGVVSVEACVTDESGDELVRIKRMIHPWQQPPTAACSNACRVLILTTPRNEAGKPQDDIAYLLSYLREYAATTRKDCDKEMPAADNFANRVEIRVVDIGKTRAPGTDWGDFDCVVVAGSVEVPPLLQPWIEAFVQGGGGLFQAGPLSLAETRLSELLPVTVTGQTVTASFMPYGQNRGVGEIPAHRLHLQKTETIVSHPILSGLPFWPAVGQDIGRARIVTPKPGATILLSFVNGGDFPQFEGRPALVVSRVGDGRVATLAFPVASGAPAVWINYARLGEYHRKLLIQCIMWTAGMGVSQPEPPQHKAVELYQESRH